MTRAPMNCEVVNNLILDWSLGGLTPRERKLMDEHLKACQSCLTNALDTKSIFFATDEQLVDSAREQIIRSGFRAEKERRGLVAKLHQNRRALAIAATLLLAGFVALALLKHREKEAHPSRSSEPMSMDSDKIFEETTTIL